MKTTPILALTATLLLPLLALAQAGPRPEDVVALRLEPSQLTLRPGATARLKLKVEIREGFHINSNKPLQDYLIPTEVVLPADAGLELVEAAFPKADLKTFSFAPDEKLAVYEGTLELVLRVRATSNPAPGTRSIPLKLRYQACNDRICLRPAERQLTLSVHIQPRERGGSPTP